MRRSEAGRSEAEANEHGSARTGAPQIQRRALQYCSPVLPLLLCAFVHVCAAEAGDRAAASSWQTDVLPADLDTKSQLSVSGLPGQQVTAPALPALADPSATAGPLRVAVAPIVPSSAAAASSQGPELMLLVLMLLALSLAVPATSLLTSLTAGARQLVRTRQTPNLKTELRPEAFPDDDDPAGPCRALVDKASYLWRLAESAVLSLDTGLPLRTLLMSEMTHVGQRLATNAAVGGKSTSALSIGHPDQYWRLLARQLKRCIADLQRIRAVADASRASFGTQANPEPRMPATLDDAYFVLGASSSVDDDTLRRLVRALRQCWHPDLSRDDKDRQYRDLRIRQINVASDLLLGHGQGQRQDQSQRQDQKRA